MFVKDLQTGTVTVASSTDAGVVGNGSSEGDPSISADGTRVAFRSTATNLDGASGNPDGVVYVKNLVTGDVSLASSSDAGLAANGGTDLGPDISGDGLRVSFWSRSTNLDPTDGDALADVYVKELLTGDIVVASTSDAGAKGNGASGTTTINHNGTVVGFGSAATNLDPGDTDTEGDAYVKEVGSAPDGDADGVPDDVDNCPATVNPGQEDQDGDREIVKTCGWAGNATPSRDAGSEFGDHLFLLEGCGRSCWVVKRSAMATGSSHSLNYATWLGCWVVRVLLGLLSGRSASSYSSGPEIASGSSFG